MLCCGLRVTIHGEACVACPASTAPAAILLHCTLIGNDLGILYSLLRRDAASPKDAAQMCGHVTNGMQNIE